MSLLVLDATPASGDDKWTHTYGTQEPANYITATAMIVADDGSIFVVEALFGEFESLVSEYSCDGFLVRHAGSGEVAWTRRWDPASLDGPV